MPRPTHYTRTVLDAIRQIVQTLNTSSRTIEKSLGISMAQLYVLDQLAGENGLTINELAERTYTHQSSVSVVVQKLRDGKYVSASPNPDDRRQVTISLTAKGRTLVKKAPDIAQERFIRSFESMPDAKQRIFAELMTEFTKSAGLKTSRPPMLFEKQR